MLVSAYSKFKLHNVPFVRVTAPNVDFNTDILNYMVIDLLINSKLIGNV